MQAYRYLLIDESNLSHSKFFVGVMSKELLAEHLVSLLERKEDDALTIRRYLHQFRA
jgi:hypothetical protein